MTETLEKLNELAQQNNFEDANSAISYAINHRNIYEGLYKERIKLETELNHWKRRCELAEDFINKSPGDPDIIKEQFEAYKK